MNEERERRRRAKKKSEEEERRRRAKKKSEEERGKLRFKSSPLNGSTDRESINSFGHADLCKNDG